MRFVILCVGSDGDVLPMMAIGSKLVELGHLVEMHSHSRYKELAIANRVFFYPLNTDNTETDDKFQLSTHYWPLFVKRHAVNWNVNIVRRLYEVASREDLVILAVDRPHLWADLIVSAHLRLPNYRIMLDLPLAVPTEKLASATNAKVESRLAASTERRWQVMIGTTVGLHAGPNQLARLLHRARPKNPFLALWPSRIIGKDTIAPVQSFGFMPAPLLTFRPTSFNHHVPNGNNPLLVFVAGTLGTTRSWSRPFVDATVRVCHALSCRGLILGSGIDYMDGQVNSVDFLPLDKLLPSTAAIIHHGGIGTAALALKHAVPQLLLPRVFAQPHNSEWMRRLGVGLVLHPREYLAGQGIVAVKRLLCNVDFQKACMDVSLSLPNPQSELSRVCDFLASNSQIRLHQTADERRTVRSRCQGNAHPDSVRNEEP